MVGDRHLAQDCVARQAGHSLRRGRDGRQSAQRSNSRGTAYAVVALTPTAPGCPATFPALPSLPAREPGWAPRPPPYPLAGRRTFPLVGPPDGCQPRRYSHPRSRPLRHQGAQALDLSGGETMAAMYGLLTALPVIWGCAGYVLVSHPGTDEPLPWGLPKWRRGEARELPRSASRRKTARIGAAPVAFRLARGKHTVANFLGFLKCRNPGRCGRVPADRIGPNTARRPGWRGEISAQAGLATSLGFAPVSAQIALVRPQAFLASLDPHQRQAPEQCVATRILAGQRRLAAAIAGGRRASSGPPAAGSTTTLRRSSRNRRCCLDPAARLGTDGVYTLSRANFSVATNSQLLRCSTFHQVTIATRLC